MKKVATGVPGLDQVILEGLLPGSCYLVRGAPGTGKTTLGLEFIYWGVVNYKEAGLIVTFEELPQQIYRDAENFGWNLRQMEREGMLRVVCTSPEVVLNGHGNFLEEMVKEIDAQRVLIDSLTHITSLMNEEREARRVTYRLINGLKRLQTSTMLIKEGDRSESPSFEEYVVDGVIALYYRERGSHRRERFLEVLKSRGQAHIPGEHAAMIGPGGLEVLPMAFGGDSYQPKVRTGLVPTGVPGVDELMRGGIPTGSTVIVAGDSGTGKTVMGLQFLSHGWKTEETPGLFLSFEETREQLQAAAGSFVWGWDFLDKGVQTMYRPMVADGSDREISLLLRAVEQLGVRRLVVDSLPVLLGHVKEDGVLRERIYWLSSALSRLGCTTILLYHAREGMDMQRLGLAESVVDGTLLLSTDLEENRRVRYLEVYKLRGINHLGGRHLMEITDHGMVVYPRAGVFS